MSNGLVQPVVKWDETINLAHQAGYLLGQADGLRKCTELERELAILKLRIAHKADNAEAIAQMTSRFMDEEHEPGR